MKWTCVYLIRILDFDKLISLKLPLSLEIFLKIITPPHHKKHTVKRLFPGLRPKQQSRYVCLFIAREQARHFITTLDKEIKLIWCFKAVIVCSQFYIR